MSQRTRRILLAVSLLSAAGVTARVLGHMNHGGTVILWLFSIASFIAALWPKKMWAHALPFRLSPVTVAVACVMLLPVAVRLLHYLPYRIHGDDLLTAYFSLAYHPKTTDFFGGVPEHGQWVSSFPTPYFLFQKLFLTVTGASLATVRWSVLPYVMVTSTVMFFIMLALANLPAAVAATWVYAFMAPSIYLETLGLHFISSTAAYLLFFYALIRALAKPSAFAFGVAGLLCGASYLFYTSSYIAFPVLCVALAGVAIHKRFRGVGLFLAAAVLGFAITVLPFMLTAARNGNVFLERVNQVSLIRGEWSPFKEQTATPEGLVRVVRDNLVLSGASLVQSGIGGHGGYTFNSQAFFTTPALVLFIAGSVLVMSFYRRKAAWWLMLLTVGVSFITGMVLTIPPPAYHRLSLTFPFIAMVSSLPVYFLTQRKRVSPLLAAGVIGTLCYYAIAGMGAARTAIAKEAAIEDARLIAYVNVTYPNRRVHIAAYPSFALEKLYFFFTPKTALSVDTEYPATYLKRFDASEPYAYIILYPKDIVPKFQAADPGGRTVHFSEKYAVFVKE